MAVRKVKVSLQISEPHLPDKETWYELISDFEQEVVKPSRIEFVITDDFDAVVGRYDLKSPLGLNSDTTGNSYTASKPGGSLAVARTIEQADDQIVVVASVFMAGLGRDLVRRMLLHEAQHVRLIQGGDTAIAVHRRAGITLAPESLDWSFTWMAESLIDEFRCERALHEKGLPSHGMVSPPEDYFEVARTLDGIRSEYYGDQDIMAAHQKCFAVLDRISSLLAYAAAAVVSGDQNLSDWSSVDLMSPLVSALSEIPSAAERIDDQKVLATTLHIMGLLRSEARSIGFESRFLEDGGLWFQFLAT